MVGHGSLTSAEGREVSTNISQSNAMLITPLQTQVFGIIPEPMIKPPNQARNYQHLSCVFSHADKARARLFAKKCRISATSTTMDDNNNNNNNNNRYRIACYSIELNASVDYMKPSFAIKSMNHCIFNRELDTG